MIADKMKFQLLLFLLHSCSASFVAPHFPSHFTANVSITSHLLTSAMQTDGYPPKIRTMQLNYNSKIGVARVDEGIISYIRRYDLKKEFKLNSGPYPSCRTSYLSEKLPTQQFQRNGKWSITIKTGNQKEPKSIQCPAPYDSKKCAMWIQDEGSGQIVHVYVSHGTWIPLIAILHTTNPKKKTLEPSLTFVWNNINLNPPNNELFQDVTEIRNDCEDQAGGFPWIHLFHHFFRV